MNDDDNNTAGPARPARVTNTRRLLDRLLADHGGIDQFVAERRARGEIWRVIARDIYNATEVDVTAETVRQWYRHLARGQDRPNLQLLQGGGEGAPSTPPPDDLYDIEVSDAADVPILQWQEQGDGLTRVLVSHSDPRVCETVGQLVARIDLMQGRIEALEAENEALRAS